MTAVPLLDEWLLLTCAAHSWDILLLSPPWEYSMPLSGAYFPLPFTTSHHCHPRCHLYHPSLLCHPNLCLILITLPFSRAPKLYHKLMFGLLVTHLFCDASIYQSDTLLETFTWGLLLLIRIIWKTCPLLCSLDCAHTYMICQPYSVYQVFRCPGCHRCELPGDFQAIIW